MLGYTYSTPPTSPADSALDEGNSWYFNDLSSYDDTGTYLLSDPGMALGSESLNVEAFESSDQYYSTEFGSGSEGATLEGVNSGLLPESYSPFIHAPGSDGLPSALEIPPITEPFSGFPDLPVAEALRPQATTPSTVMPYGHSSLPDHTLQADPLSHDTVSSGGAAVTPSHLGSRYDPVSSAIQAYNHAYAQAHQWPAAALSAPGTLSSASEHIGAPQAYHITTSSPPPANSAASTSLLHATPGTSAEGGILQPASTTIIERFANGRKEFLCPICGEWRTSHNRRQHLATHDETRERHYCPLGLQCKAGPTPSWSRPADMWEHVRGNHPSYPAPPKQKRDKNNTPRRSPPL